MFAGDWRAARAAGAALMTCLCLWSYAQGHPPRYLMEFQIPSRTRWHSGVDLLSMPDSVILALDSNGQLWLNRLPTDVSSAVPTLAEVYNHRADRVVFLRIADNRSYQELIDLGDIARAAGARVLVMMAGSYSSQRRPLDVPAGAGPATTNSRTMPSW